MVTTSERPPRRMGEREFVLLVVALMGCSAYSIDTMIPAFAAIREAFDLAPDSTKTSLTITLFFFGNGLGFFLYGPLADSIGRKRVIHFSLGLYGLAAIAAALAPTLTILYAARFMWGFASAGPRILSQAILRDRFEGTALARAMTLAMTVFYVIPIAAPIIGRGVLEVGGWRWVFGSGAVLATLLITWSLRMVETLAPANRRPFRPGAIGQGFVAVGRNPVTRWYGISVAVGFGAFYSFLGSSELVLSDIFGRPTWFVPFFVIASLLTSCVAFSANRALKRVRPRNWAMGAGMVFFVSSVALLATAVATDGRPDVWVFLFLYVSANASFSAVFPTANSIALQPMGPLAGTAAAAMGAATSFVGAALAALIDRAVDDTITPVAIGYCAYASAALATQVLGHRAEVRAENVTAVASVPAPDPRSR